MLASGRLGNMALMRFGRSLLAGASPLRRGPQPRHRYALHGPNLQHSALSSSPADSPQPAGVIGGQDPTEDPEVAAKVKCASEALVNGDRRVLSRAITLVESSNPKHYTLAQQLLADALFKVNNPENGQPHQCIRLGIAGPPGAGKSTFIEALGLYLTKEKGGHCLV